MVTLDLGPGASASPAAQRPGEQRTTKVGEALEGRPARHAQLRSLLAELSQWEAVGEETSIALVRKQEKISELQATVGDRSQELQRLREELLLTQRQAEELTSAHNAAVAQAKALSITKVTVENQRDEAVKQLSSARMAILEAQLGCSEAEKEAHLCREELERLRLDLEGEATARQEVQQQCKEMEAAVTRSEAQLKVACDRVAQSDAMAQLLKEHLSSADVSMRQLQRQLSEETARRSCAETRASDAMRRERRSGESVGTSAEVCMAEMTEWVTSAAAELHGQAATALRHLQLLAQSSGGQGQHLGTDAHKCSEALDAALAAMCGGIQARAMRLHSLALQEGRLEIVEREVRKGWRDARLSSAWKTWKACVTLDAVRSMKIKFATMMRKKAMLGKSFHKWHYHCLQERSEEEKRAQQQEVQVRRAWERWRSRACHTQRGRTPSCKRMLFRAWAQACRGQAAGMHHQDPSETNLKDEVSDLKEQLCNMANQVGAAHSELSAVQQQAAEDTRAAGQLASLLHQAILKAHQRQQHGSSSEFDSEFMALLHAADGQLAAILQDHFGLDLPWEWHDLAVPLSQAKAPSSRLGGKSVTRKKPAAPTPTTTSGQSFQAEDLQQLESGLVSAESHGVTAPTRSENGSCNSNKTTETHSLPQSNTCELSRDHSRNVSDGAWPTLSTSGPQRIEMQSSMSRVNETSLEGSRAARPGSQVDEKLQARDGGLERSAVEQRSTGRQQAAAEGCQAVLPDSCTSTRGTGQPTSQKPRGRKAQLLQQLVIRSQEARTRLASAAAGPSQSGVAASVQHVAGDEEKAECKASRGCGTEGSVGLARAREVHSASLPHGQDNESGFRAESAISSIGKVDYADSELCAGSQFCTAAAMEESPCDSAGPPTQNSMPPVPGGADPRILITALAGRVNSSKEDPASVLNLSVATDASTRVYAHRAAEDRVMWYNMMADVSLRTEDSSLERSMSASFLQSFHEVGPAESRKTSLLSLSNPAYAVQEVQEWQGAAPSTATESTHREAEETSGHSASCSGLATIGGINERIFRRRPSGVASEGGQGTDPGSIQTVTSLQDDSRRQKAADSVVQEATGGLRFAAKAIDAESSFISALSASQLSMNDTLNTSKGGSDVSNLSMKLTEWWHMQEAEWDRARQTTGPKHSRAPSMDIEALGEVAALLHLLPDVGTAKRKVIQETPELSTTSLDMSRSLGQSFDMDMSSEVAAVLHALSEAGHANGKFHLS